MAEDYEAQLLPGVRILAETYGLSRVAVRVEGKALQISVFRGEVSCSKEFPIPNSNRELSLPLKAWFSDLVEEAE